MKLLKDIESVIVIVVTVVAAIVLGSYLFAYFSFDWIISNKPSDWGPLGDYFGGILNPVIALAALVALIRATKLQKSEFMAMRNHLKDEAKKMNYIGSLQTLSKRLSQS